MSAVAKKTAAIIPFPSAKPDPVFARIDAWRAAEQAFEAAVGRQSQLEQELWSNCGKDITDSQAYIVIGGTRITDSAGIDRRLAYEQASIRAVCGGAKNATALLAAARKSRRAELRKMLSDARAALKVRQDATGWTAICREWERAASASSRALRALCGTKPVTVEGLAGMLGALQKRMEEGCGIGEFADGRTDKLFATLAKASAAIAAKAGRK